MKKFWLSLTIICWFAYFLSRFANAGEFPAVPGEYIVKSVAKRSLVNFFQNKQADRRVLSHLSSGALHVRLTGSAKAELESTYALDYIEPNYIYTASVAVPKESWGLKNDKGTSIDIEGAWKVTMGRRDVVVAVIDTGVDYGHEALKGSAWVNRGEIPGDGIDNEGNGYIDDVYGMDFANNDSDPMDDNMHGTHCAGVIAADHVKMMGVAPKVKVMGVKFLTGSGSGSLDAAIKSIDYAVANGANVLSNSWGGGGFSQALMDAIVNAKDKGVLFVAAAGNEYNDNDARPSYPASYDVDNIISVAASDVNGKKASFSNYGAKSVHVFAPGVNIWSTVPGNLYKNLSGTSMATPHVSGLAALLLSSDRDMDYTAIKETILTTSKELTGLKGYVQTNGLINATQSLR